MKNHFVGLLNGVIVWTKVVISFFVLFQALLLFYIPLIFVLPFRLILSIILKIFYKNKYKLVSSYNGIYAAWNSTGNLPNITTFLLIDGPCDVEKLQERVKENILKADKFGHQPYDKLLKVYTEKFKFLCSTSDESTAIDFTHHIRILPGQENSLKVLSEPELFEICAKEIDSEWSELKPRWEILVAPKVKKEESDKICSVLFLKFHHIYMDGISVVQFIRNCIADQPSSVLSIDPVNPPIPKIPLTYKIIIDFRSFIVEPYNILKNFSNTTDPFLSKEEISGKLYGRTKMGISQETIRHIRKYFHCSTQAVLHAAFLGALEKMAKVKGIQIPSEIIAAVVSAVLPYPDELPRNRAYFAHQLVKTKNNNDSIQRLREINKFMMGLQRRKYALESTIMLSKLLVLYPLPIMRFIVKYFKPCYYISNIPGYAEHLRLQGKYITEVFGVPPLCNGIGFCAAAGFYEKTLLIGFLVNKSAIIRDRRDMEAWIFEFEKQICDLRNMARLKHNHKLSTDNL